jgi:hypothetical protein
MFLVKHHITVLLQHVLDSWENLLREPRHAGGFLDVGEHCGCRVEGAVRVDGGWVARCEPVEGDVGENVVEAGCGFVVGPFEEFLADPVGIVLGRGRRCNG